MPKNILQDVIPRGRRISYRKTSSARQGHDNRHEVPVYNEENSENLTRPVHELRYVHREEETVDWRDGGQNFFSRWIIWIIGIVSAGVLIFILGNIFSKATVTLTPKSQAVKVNLLSFTAKPNVTAPDLSYTSFQPPVLEKEISIPADGEKPVEIRATGKIIIYNNYSATTQRLIKNTRFETPDGLIYKITDSVTVPGRHLAGGKIVPGSIEVSVYAESAGEEYNIGLTDFTIPGFKSNPERFANFYGRSKTAMTGGKIGTEKTISDEKMLQARKNLDAELLSELLDEARANLPADSIFYDGARGAYHVKFESVTSSSAVKNNVVVREKARFTAYFIKNKDLAGVIAKNLIDNFNGAPVALLDAEKLTFDLINKDSLSATSVGPIKFSLKGGATIVWQIDENKLSAELAGKKKNELSKIASGYPAIFKAEAVIRPFWDSAFPKSADKIKVEIEAVR